MQFRLKTLFLLILITSLALGYWLFRQKQIAQLKEHYAKFERLENTVSLMSADVKTEIMKVPEILSALQTLSETVPENYLSGGYGGSSSLGSHNNQDAEFEFEIRYQWPNEDHQYVDENSVRLTTSSEFDHESFDAHVVKISYPDTAPNKQIAKWIESRLTKDHDIVVEHQIVPAKTAVNELAPKETPPDHD